MKVMNLTKDPIPKLIRTLAIPASIGFFFNTMYNVVDTYFAGLVSTIAQSSLSLSFPVFFIIIAIGSGVGSGVTALIGTSLGKGNKKEAQMYATQALSFSVILGIILTIVGYLVSPSLFKFLGASGDYLNMSVQYMNMLFTVAIFFILGFVINGILNALGDTKSYRNVLILGFFINMLLSPALMFGWWIFPELGFTGIAGSTAVIQIISFIYMSYKVIKTDLFEYNGLSEYKPVGKYFKDISYQGFPAGLSMMTVAIGVFVITFYISKFGPEAVAAYGIATRVEQIALLPVIGINIAALTLISQNLGANKYKRVKETVKKCYQYGLSIMVIGFVAVFFFSDWWMKLFTKDDLVVGIGSQYLKISSWIFFAYIALFMSDAIYRGFKKPIPPLLVGLTRQIVAPLILFYLVVFAFGLSIIWLWWSIFTIVWISAIAYVLMVWRMLKRDGS
jgi:putative MATE family efflux protein